MAVTNISEQNSSETVLQAIKIYQIYKTGQSEVVALKGLDLELNSAEFLAIIGPSGAGKSSLLNILGGMMRPSAGIVLYNDIDITKLPETELVDFRRKTVGFVFQEGNLLPFQSAQENVENTLKFLGLPREIRKKRAKELLTRVGLAERIKHPPTKLSGGEQQRVAIARALAAKPTVILADEPTGNLDDETSVAILELFKELKEETGTAFLIVTHDRLVASFASRSLELRDGMIVGQHGAKIDFDDMDFSRLIQMSPEGRITIPPNLLNEIYSQVQVPLVLWRGRVENLPLDSQNETSNLVPSLVLSPIIPKRQFQGSSPEKSEFKICMVCENQVPVRALFCVHCGARFK